MPYGTGYHIVYETVVPLPVQERALSTDSATPTKAPWSLAMHNAAAYATVFPSNVPKIDVVSWNETST